MSGKVSYLGEFEQVVLLAVAHLAGEASGPGLRAEISARAGRAVSIGAIYATLDRLVAKGHLRARDESAREGNDARVRRFFTLTAGGAAALETARELQTRMWRGVDLRKAVKPRKA
jgi:DNA-binding PadR family transcriptional regulator